jgi:hypothetical protein
MYVVGDPGVIERFTVEPLAQVLLPTNATFSAHLLKLDTFAFVGREMMRANPAVEKFPELLT